MTVLKSVLGLVTQRPLFMEGVYDIKHTADAWLGWVNDNEAVISHIYVRVWMGGGGSGIYYSLKFSPLFISLKF